MSKPKVSVLITTFNRSELLCRAVDSVLAQDFPSDEREIIIVDDGSTDDTKQRVQERFGDKVRYLHKPNGGINSACAFGFEAAKGEIIAQLDSDDYWYPHKLSTCVPLFDRYSDVVAVFHDLDMYRGNDPAITGTCWKSLNITLTDTPCDALQSYLEGHPVPAWTSGSLWRRSTLMNLLPFPEGLWGFNDAYCARNIIFYGNVCALRQSLGGYLVHTTNDYGGDTYVRSKARIERILRESKIMSEVFNHNCRKFGHTPSKRRILVQQMAMAEMHLNLMLLESRWAAISWLLNNDLNIPALVKLQSFFNITLPSRLAIFIKNRIIGKIVSLD